MSAGNPPVERRPQQLNDPFDQRVDDYAWLRDDSRSRREVLAQLRREDLASEAWFRPLRKKLDQLHSELKSRIPDADEGVPVRRGDYQYYWRDTPGRDHPRYYRRAVDEPDQEVLLLDAQRRGAGSGGYTLGELLPSPDGRYLAVTEDREGDGVFELRIKDLRRQRWLPEVVESVDDGVVWSADSKRLLYVHKDPGTLAALEVRAHRLRSDPAQDQLIHREIDPHYYVSLGSSHSMRYLLIHAEATRQSKLLRLPADDPLAAPQTISEHSGQARIYYDDDGTHAWLLSDHQAPNFQLLRGDINDPGGNPWEVVVAHDDAVVLEDFLPTADFLLLVERRNLQLGLRIIDRHSGEQRSLFEADGISALTLDDNPEPDPHRIRVRRDYWQQPGELLELDLVHLFQGSPTVAAEASLRLLKRDALAGAFSAGDYRVERIEVGSAAVPVTALRHRDTPLNGSAPLWLYGYGAYGESLDPGFDADRLSLLDRGVIIAYAHVRGGGERGARWHDQGRAAHKANSYADFVAVADALVERGYAAANRIIAVGGSAGGLLVAAALNRRPKRFAAALLQVPFVDVLSTMLDPSLPLTELEYAEWGDPRREADYRAMASWSPYDNLREAAYPAVLATAGLHDGQVAYWEPAKYIARLRQLSSNDQPALLKIDLDAGHQGVTGRYSSLAETVISYGFALQVLRAW